jgi:hypothetical protein
MRDVFLAIYSPSGRVEPRRGEGFFGARFEGGFAKGSRTFCVLKALPASISVLGGSECPKDAFELSTSGACLQLAPDTAAQIVDAPWCPNTADEHESCGRFVLNPNRR